MKKNYTLLLSILLFFSLTTNAQDGLFISEVADPADEYTGRFIELYNAGSAAVDFSTTVVYLSRQSNGGTAWGEVQLSGTVAAGATFVLGGSSFATLYGFAPDQETGIINGNGDDAYFLYTGGDHISGTLHDIYGEIDTDGTGLAWEYTDSRAFRVGGITQPNTTWTASEWEVSSANVADFNPGTHSTEVVVDTDAPVWETGYPAADNVEDVQFDLLAQLDETSTVYFVVLSDGATTPTVTEVMAGTGSAGAAAVVAGSFSAGTSLTSETVTGLNVETSYDVYVVAEDDEATPNIQAAASLVEITTVVMPDVLVMADFETNLSPFTAVSIVGAQEWGIGSYGGSYANISGFDGIVLDNDDYLISPAINLDGSTSNTVEFITARSSHPGLPLKVFISSDFSGTYDSVNVVTANWIDISDQFTLSDGSYTWTESGQYDLSTYSGTVYIAFVYYSNVDDGAATWEVDNFTVTGFLIPGSDATLGDLMVDGTTIEGFDAAKQNYVIELPAGAAVVPDVTYTTTDVNASAVVTPAADLSGDAAARTTTVVVTAQDGTTTQTYSITFNPILEVADIAALRAATDFDRKYQIIGEVVLTHKDSYRNKKYFEDATGGIEIDDDPGVIVSVYNIGDGVTGITGKLNNYYGMLQFQPSNDPGTATSTGNTVDPQVITINEFNTNFDVYEAEFVKISGVVFEDAGADFANRTNYVISVGEESSVLRTAFDGAISGKIPKMADVQGVALWHYSEAKVGPRMATDVMAYSSDASLSDLMVDGTSVDGFNSTTYTYNVTLPVGTADVPVVTYAKSDDNATAIVTDATNLTGDEATRTTSVLVTAQDGTEQTYSIIFTVQQTGIEDRTLMNLNVYPVPAVNEIFVTGLSDKQSFDVVNILGSTVRTVNVTGDVVRVDLSELNAGIYMIITEDASVRFVKQ